MRQLCVNWREFGLAIDHRRFGLRGFGGCSKSERRTARGFEGRPTTGTEIDLLDIHLLNRSGFRRKSEYLRQRLQGGMFVMNVKLEVA